MSIYEIQKLNKLLIIALILSVTIVTAQKSDADFVYDLGGSIEKMTVTDSGVLLITHSKGLAGIKPGQKELVFNLLGETLISMKTNAKEIEVDLSALPSATYFVKIISDGRGKVVKVNEY